MKINTNTDFYEADNEAICTYLKGRGLDPANYATEFEVDGQTLKLKRHLLNDDGRKYTVFTEDGEELASVPFDIDMGREPEWLRNYRTRIGADTPSTSQTERLEDED